MNTKRIVLAFFSLCLITTMTVIFQSRDIGLTQGVAQDADGPCEDCNEDTFTGDAFLGAVCIGNDTTAYNLEAFIASIQVDTASQGDPDDDLEGTCEISYRFGPWDTQSTDCDLIIKDRKVVARTAGPIPVVEVASNPCDPNKEYEFFGQRTDQPFEGCSRGKCKKQIDKVEICHELVTHDSSTLLLSGAEGGPNDAHPSSLKMLGECVVKVKVDTDGPWDFAFAKVDFTTEVNNGFCVGTAD